MLPYASPNIDLSGALNESEIDVTIRELIIWEGMPGKLHEFAPAEIDLV